MGGGPGGPGGPGGKFRGGMGGGEDELLFPITDKRVLT